MKSSDDFFELENKPEKVAIIGSGYIGVEFAGIFNGLGVETHLFMRSDSVLRGFETSLAEELEKEMISSGIKIHKLAKIKKVIKEDEKLTIYNGDDEYKGFDHFFSCIGRGPLTKGLNLKEVGIETNEKGQIIVDEYQVTNVTSILAVGDVVGRYELTPVAIKVGRLLGDRLFGGKKHSKMEWDNIPTVVFSTVELGTGKLFLKN
jgi:glutathione reductase (NADPH)